MRKDSGEACNTDLNCLRNVSELQSASQFGRKGISLGRLGVGMGFGSNLLGMESLEPDFDFDLRSRSLLARIARAALMMQSIGYAFSFQARSARFTILPLSQFVASG